MNKIPPNRKTPGKVTGAGQRLREDAKVLPKPKPIAPRDADPKRTYSKAPKKSIVFE